MNIAGITSSSISFLSPTSQTQSTDEKTSLLSNSPKISQEGQSILDLARDLGVEDLNFSVEELRKIDSLYNQLDKLFGLDKLPDLTAEQEKQLDGLDAQINKLFDAAGDKPLTQEQEKQLDQLFAQQDKILGFDNIKLSEADEKLVQAIEDQLDQLFASKLGPIDFDADNPEVDSILSQLDTIFGYDKQLSADQSKQVDKLYEQIDKILNANTNGLNEKQNSQLNKLFAEVDKVYQARSFESLSATEKQTVDDLLTRLDKIDA